MSPYTAMIKNNAGNWVQSNAQGTAYLGGSPVAFAPPAAGTVDEWFTFPTPAAPDWPDDAVSVGCRFATTANGSWVGNRVWLAATASVGVTESVQGFNDDTESLIAPVTPLAGGLPRGQYVNQMFTTPAAIVPGVNYTAAFFTRQYGFTRPSEGAVLPFLSTRLYTDGSAMSAVAFFGYGTAVSRPASSSPNFHFHVSPIVRFPA